MPNSKVNKKPVVGNKKVNSKLNGKTYKVQKPSAASKSKQIVPSKRFPNLVNASCGASPHSLTFYPDLSKFAQLGEVLWYDLLLKGADVTAVSPGQLGFYLRQCYYSYIKMHGAWSHPNDDIPNMGSVVIPYGISRLFKQCSTYKHKKEGWEYRVQTIDDPSVLLTPINSWPNQVQYVFSTDDITTVPNTNVVNAFLSDSMIYTIDHLLVTAYPDAVTVNEITWGAVTCELFSGLNGTSLAMVYPWSSVCSLLLPEGQFFNFTMGQDVSLAMQISLWARVVAGDDKFTTIAHNLRSADYDPVMYRAIPVLFDCQYAAQVMDKVIDETAGLADSDYFNFNQVCWAYIAAFVPLVTAIVTPNLLPNVSFKKWKMSFPIQQLANQQDVRCGSNYYYPIYSDETTHNWSDVFQGAGTSSFIGFGSPGFVSSSVPSNPTFGGKTWTAATQNANYISNSWTYASEGYRITQNSSGDGMKSVKSPKCIDCGCFAAIDVSDNGISRSNSVLGSYRVKVIKELYCSTPLALGMCSVASALSWRTSYITSDTFTATGKRSKTLNDQGDNELSTIVSYSVAAASTSVQVAQAARMGIDNYVKDQASGGYDFTLVGADDIMEFVQNVAANSPMVQRAGNYAVERLISLLPSTVPLDEVIGLAMSVGTAGSALLGKALVSKKIGFASSGSHNEF